jgi:hypothetical protein
LAALDALSASLCCITAAAAARTVIADATDEFFALMYVYFLNYFGLFFRQ